MDYDPDDVGRYAAVCLGCEHFRMRVFDEDIVRRWGYRPEPHCGLDFGNPKGSRLGGRVVDEDLSRKRVAEYESYYAGYDCVRLDAQHTVEMLREL